VSVCAQINITCDYCGEESDTWHTVSMARWAARRDGWRKRKIDGKWLDICDACQDQQNEIECRDALAQAVSA
jgi:hypothetical protein